MIVFPLLADSVIFYVGEAEIHRSVSLPKGKRFEIYGLPMDLSGLRIWASSGYVASYSLRDTVLPSDMRKYDSLRTILRTLNRQISHTNARYVSLKYEKDLLLSYTSKEVREPAKNLLALSRTVERATFIMDSLKAVSDSLIGVRKALERRLEELKARQKVLTVELKGFKGGKLFVVYRVRASWSPTYVFRASPDKGKLKMEVVAEVRNFSSLPIATERVVVTTSQPPGYSPPKHRRWVLREVRRYRAVEEEVIAATPERWTEKFPHPQPPVRRSFTYVSTRYEYGGSIAIPPMDRATAQIPLFKRTYDAHYLTTAYPEVSPRAYMSAVFTPDEDLASGRATVYLDGEMTARYTYEGGKRGVPDTLFVGYDPFVTGEVKLISQKRRDRRRGKRTFTVETRVEEITVRNGREKSIPVTVYVRRPFAGGNVNVQYVRFKPKPKRDLGDGLMMWEVDLKPKGTFTVRREMRVEYPKGATLNW